MTSPEERFTGLFQRTQLPLLAYAVRRVSDPAEAADVVAETFLVAWRRIDEVPEGGEARAWMYGVARRVGLSRATVRVRLHRARRRLAALMEELDAEAETVAVKRNPRTGHVMGETAIAVSDTRGRR
ncbi:MAG: hypothetical protein LWW86_12785 [Micrococcales bacterium]|nr:hypothetical protein [Micrococcales bacterium]